MVLTEPFIYWLLNFTYLFGSKGEKLWQFYCLVAEIILFDTALTNYKKEKKRKLFDIAQSPSCSRKNLYISLSQSAYVSFYLTLQKLYQVSLNNFFISLIQRTYVPWREERGRERRVVGQQGQPGISLTFYLPYELREFVIFIPSFFWRQIKLPWSQWCDRGVVSSITILI